MSVPLPESNNANGNGNESGNKRPAESLLLGAGPVSLKRVRVELRSEG